MSASEVAAYRPLRLANAEPSQEETAKSKHRLKDLTKQVKRIKHLTHHSTN